MGTHVISNPDGTTTLSNDLGAGIGVPAATAATHGVQASQTIGRNKIVNGGFRVNQLAYVSGTSIAVAPGVLSTNFAHDMWRNGTNPSNYTFTQSKGNTIVTIAAGSFITAVEDVNVQNTKYVLSWSGGAVARFGVNGAVPSGNFAASPIYITTAVAGTQMNFEFAMAGSVGGSTVVNSGSGTLGTVQCEEGIFQTTFENQKYDQVLRECQRYLPVWNYADGGNLGVGYSQTTSTSVISISLPVVTRVPITNVSLTSSVYITIYNGVGTGGASIGLSLYGLPTTKGVMLTVTTTAGTPTLVAGQGAFALLNNAAAQLWFTGAQI